MEARVDFVHPRVPQVQVPILNTSFVTFRTSRTKIYSLVRRGPKVTNYIGNIILIFKIINNEYITNLQNKGGLNRPLWPLKFGILNIKIQYCT